MEVMILTCEGQPCHPGIKENRKWVVIRGTTSFHFSPIFPRHCTNCDSANSKRAGIIQQ